MTKMHFPEKSYEDTKDQASRQELPKTEREFEDKIETVLIKSTLGDHSSSLVLERLSVMYVTGEYRDVVFHCNGGTISSHKVVLAGLSDHLRNLFLLCGQEDVHVYLPEIKVCQMEEFLKKVYIGGQALLEDFSDVVDILKVFGTCEPLILNRRELENKGTTHSISVDKVVHSLDIFPCMKEESFDEEITPNGDNAIDYNEFDEHCENDGPSWSSKRTSPKKELSLLDKLNLPHYHRTKKPSLIWQYFNKTRDFVTCNTCCVQFKNHGNTTNASNHLKQHPEVYVQFRADVNKQNDENQLDLNLKNEITEMLEPKQKERQKLEQLKQEVVTKMPRPKRSAIWDHFKARRDIEHGLRGECNYCGLMMTNRCGSTSAMISHLKRKHPNETERYVTRRMELEGGETFWRFARFDKEFAVCTICQEKFAVAYFSKPELLKHIQLSHSELYDEAMQEMNKMEKSDKTEVVDVMDDTSEIVVGVVDSNTTDKVLVKKMNNPAVKLSKTREKKKRGRKTNVAMLANSPETRTCTDCEKVFSTRGGMLYHCRVVHSDVKPFTCEFCGKSFARKDSYDGHVTQHDAVLPFMCCHCGKTFARRHRRDVHERSHTGEFRFSCDYCPKQFTCKQKKVEHERVHTGEKPYQCSNCGRQFAKQNQLVTHFRIHTGEKPYHCQKCVQNFRHLSSYRNHRCASPTNQQEKSL